MTSEGPGEGPDAVPVLFVHWFASSAEHHWRQPGWLDLVAEAGRETIAVDLLGHGTAPRPTSPAAHEAGEAQVAAAMDGYEQVDAVGFSAGAHVLLRLVTAQPARFGRVALLGVGDGALTGTDPEPEEVGVTTAGRRTAGRRTAWQRRGRCRPGS